MDDGAPSAATYIYDDISLESSGDDASVDDVKVPGIPSGARRSFDLLFALLLTVVFSPVILAVTFALWVSKGPVLFSQVRVGHGGRRFRIYKFATMIPDAQQVLDALLARDAEVKDEWEKNFKLKNDPRVTPIGRLLRRTSLDELPQLWNVVMGDMGMVGPRPVEPFEVVKYGRYVRYYFSQKPGLTGLWQVSGRNDTGYARRVAIDSFYARNRSIALDAKIIIKTIGVVLFGSGAY